MRIKDNYGNVVWRKILKNQNHTNNFLLIFNLIIYIKSTSIKYIIDS